MERVSQAATSGAAERAAGRAIDRREALKGVMVGLTGTAIGVLFDSERVALAGETAGTASDAASAESDTVGAFTRPEEVGSDSGDTPAELAAIGGSTMSLYELNCRRHELVDSKGDFVGSDGTVVPAVWNKLRTLFNTYGFGVGAAQSADGFQFFQYLFSEDEAQAYIEMPYGIMFTAADYSEQSGRDEEECLELCEDLSHRGLLYRVRRAGVPYFSQLAIAHGLYEYNLAQFSLEWIDGFSKALTFGEGEGGPRNGGTHAYYSIPCSADIVADEEILPLDDYERVVDRNEVIAVSPCQCRMVRMIAAGMEVPAVGSDELREYISPCGHYLETCMTFGEEAEYYIENGIGRQIDKDEARSILRRSVDEGMVMQSCFTKDSEVICSCHGDCCSILSGNVAVGAEGMALCNVTPNVSHYTLEYDRDICVRCGACAERCPMYAIEFDEDGYPSVNALCMRCGQCGMVCPVGARALVAKPVEERLEMPDNLIGDYNLKAAYRFDHDMVR